MGAPRVLVSLRERAQCDSEGNSRLKSWRDAPRVAAAEEDPAMRTTINGKGQITIPEEVQRADRLSSGDSFDLQRLQPGRYLLSRQEPASSQFEVITAEDGLPAIRLRVPGAPLTSELVKEVESQTA